MAIHEEHGGEGLEALAENTNDLLHYVYMSRIAGTRSRKLKQKYEINHHCRTPVIGKNFGNH